MRSDVRKRIFGIVNMDELFHKAQARGDALLLDKFDFSRPGYADDLSNSLYSRSTDIDFIARCECGHLTGNSYVGTTCNRCRTVVSQDMEAADGHLNHRVFLSCPDSIPGWIHPHIYRILSRWMTYGEARNKINILDNILDPTAPLLLDLEGVVTGRGFTYLYNNFDYLMEFFLVHYKRTAEKAKTDPVTGMSNMRHFLNLVREKVFCRYLPVLSSALHPIIMSDGSNPGRQRYVDKNTKHVLAAANALSYLRHSPRQKFLRQDVVEETAFTAFKEHIAYLEEISTKQLAKKKSLPRRHIFGARMHLSARGVIVPIFGDHDYDTIYFPWQIGVNMFRDDIVGRLVRNYGMSIARAMYKQQTALQIYDEDIHRMMDDFITECPYKGIPLVVNRNPKLGC